MQELQHLTTSRRLLPFDWHYLYAVTLKTLVYADDMKIRWLMAFVATTTLQWGCELLSLEVA